MRFFVLIILVINSSALWGQYRFSGEVSRENTGNAIYLSLVEDYRKSSRVYLDQIVQKTKVDSLGHFYFEGNNLNEQNRIYRIHLDGCSDNTGTNHFLGKCNNSKNVLFIANNKDTLKFPTSFEDQSLCTISSTNPNSGLLLEIENLKGQMAYDFVDYPSKTNKKLNLVKWFKNLHSFGRQTNEPLAELYIYDFISDKRNETFRFYLEDLTNNDYYENLSERLTSTYPEAEFTQQYRTEITTDKELASFNRTKSSKWNRTIIALLAVSVLGNVVFFLGRKKKDNTSQLLEKLTLQEQKITNLMLENKTNKEIASELFVSVSTIKTHINNLYKKLGISSREEMVVRFKK
ncbi:helix-turn-helix transcriptional regulator [Flagellimonas halotolerans]|uniref:Helix-turn-helix transcriptional regulator n=1 Tax=Flagellimonas halotolerans TaxID=3112164 RepID=A0ABU6ITP4_9FLAO|nr:MULTISPECIES: helix-turn-helix transcriptional regulator [unclassified Allomuricauda]MEC3966526.1 helix-turn-helix transcriptional regulator [Muricauda sp. SYSU M86414]MEC4266337.1 helix-turn-helix transcriptional regulator [Muricauda sp. SYSU M84420]